MVIIIVIHHVMQIKTIIAYCFTSNQTAIIKKTDNNNCQGRGELGLSTMLQERSQSQKTIRCMIPFMQNI